jgi:hypothetical protein
MAYANKEKKLQSSYMGDEAEEYNKMLLRQSLGKREEL